MLSSHQDFVLQWNITSLCEYSCIYCYMKTNFASNTQLDADFVLKQIIEFRRNFTNFHINITGGNPLLHQKFEHLVCELYRNNIHIRVLGNPLIKGRDKAIIKRIARYLDYYQISIDGDLGNTLNRGSRDIEQRWDTIDYLQELGIRTCVMFTLTDNNAEEIISVLDACIKKNVSTFTFSRVVRDGAIKNICSNKYSMLNYKGILQQVFEYLVEKDIDIFSFKDTLWTLFLYEKGLYNINDSSILGCGAGINTMCIMPSGIVQPCSRLPLSIGNIQDETLLDIWNTSPLLQTLRNFSKYEKCGNCSLVSVCRGCRAISYAEFHDILTRDPYCWM